MVSDKNLKEAKKMAEARDDGKIVVPELAMAFNPYEYAQLLDAQEKGQLEARVEDLKQQVKKIENEARAEETEDLMQHPEVKRIFKLSDDEEE